MGLYISSVTFYNQKCNLIVRQGSNERDSSSPTERVSPVILSEAKELSAERDRPFASLRVTRWDGCNGEGLFFTTEPCLKFIIGGGRDESAPMSVKSRKGVDLPVGEGEVVGGQSLSHPSAVPAPL